MSASTGRMAARLTFFCTLLFAACDGPSAPDGPYSLEVINGDAQAGLIGIALADSIVVRVTTPGGGPAPNVNVTWDAGAGSVAGTETDASGIAMASWTLGQVPGAQTLEISAEGVSGTVTATASIATPGTVYRGRKAYVQYVAGTLPIVISAPHGGTLEPSEIPDRVPPGTFVRDVNTTELANQIAEALETRTGARPHVIAMLLHRRKIDANRDNPEATKGDPLALQAWNEYHGFIAHAKDRIDEAHGAGFYIDLHGHGHDIQRLELGYLLTATDLSLGDGQLDTPAFRDKSTLRVLALEAPGGFVPLLRGPTSLGERFELQGFPAVPSATQPGPGANPYFSGGYNTERHSVWGDGVTAGVQIEANFAGVRDSPASRAAFAAAAAAALEQYFADHYGIDLGATTSFTATGVSVTGLSAETRAGSSRGPGLP